MRTPPPAKPPVKLRNPAPPVNSQTNKLDRIADHSRALVDETRTWVDLRIQLAKLDLKEEINAKIDEVRATVMEQVNKAQAAFMAEYATTIVLGAIAGLLGLLGLTFLFITLALGIGTLIGAMWLGFLIVTVLLLAAGGLVALQLKKRFDKGIVSEDDAEEEKAKKLSENQAPRLSEPSHVEDVRARPEGDLPVPAEVAGGHAERPAVRV